MPEKLLVKSVSELGIMTFALNSFVEEIKLTKPLCHIEGRSFMECIALKTINIPANVQALSAGTFEDCLSLEKILLKGEMDISAVIAELSENIIIVKTH